MRSRLDLALAFACLACGGEPTTHDIVNTSATTTVGAGGGGGATSTTGASSSVGVGGAGVGGEGGAASSVAASTSSSSASTGAGGAPPECANQVDGTHCTETCGCPPCGPIVNNVDCTEGLCQAGACVAHIPVVCLAMGTPYQGCDGVPHNYYVAADPDVVCWDTNSTGYCPKGTPCTAYPGKNLNNPIVGTCQ